MQLFRWFSSFALVGLVAAPALGSDVEVRVLGSELEGDAPSVRVSLAWKNAWRTERNHDAAWVFLRLARPSWSQPLRIDPGRLGTLAGGARLEASRDGMGVFVSCAEPCRGEVAFELELPVDDTSVPERPGGYRLDAHAIEMVWIPEGAFEVGEPDPESELVREACALYRSGPDGAHAGTYRIESEATIDVSAREGALWYQTSGNEPQYNGDQQGPIPAAFPKGFAGFYCMKYELSQGEYAQFLNGLWSQAAGMRAIGGSPEYHRDRGSLTLGPRGYIAASPRRPANFVSWEDGLAFCDWAGLRPLTELEYTKAVRGPRTPVSGEHAWGSPDTSAFLRIVGANGDLVTDGDADEALLDDASAPRLGASYFWVMDLSGSAWERVVSLGHPAGRAFAGSHGDGIIDYDGGCATNPDWPRGDSYAQFPGAGGYGYRGGGFYHQSSRPLDDRAPDVKVAFRRYAAWGEAPRYVAYGFRAGSSAPGVR